MTNRRIDEQMAAYGFRLQTTGGDCSAYVRPTLGDGVETVTREDGPSVPDGLGQPVTYGLYDADGQVLVTWPRVSLRDLLTDLQFARDITRPAVIP